MRVTTILPMAIAALTVVLTGCGDDPVIPIEPSGPTISVFAGTGQQGEPGERLSQPLRVRVTDAGVPVAGVAVTWRVESGNGGLEPIGPATDGEGVAGAIYRLGSTVGPQVIVATADGIETPARFTVTATTAPVRVTLVATVPVPANYGHHDTFVRDGLAFVLAWNSGVYIYDVGNGMRGGSPSNPQLVSHYVTSASGVPGGPQVHNAWWFHNPVSGEARYLFIGQEGPGAVGNSSSGDIHVVDVSDLANPQEVASLHLAGAGVHNFWMDEPRQVLYAAYYNGGVIAVDVSGVLTGSLDSRVIAQAFPGGEGNAFTWGVQLVGNTLYASDMLNGLWAFDRTTLAPKVSEPNVVSRFTSDLVVRGSVAYTGTWGTRSGHRGNVINVFTLDDGVPTLEGLVNLPDVGTVSDVGISANGRLLVATAEGGIAPGLYVYDRTDPLHPTLLAHVHVDSGLHTGEVADIDGRTYVFAARNPAGPALMIFDITDVTP